jgi:hypothetical protein
MFCCKGFANLVAEAGKRGLSAGPVSSKYGKAFMLRARSCDAAEIPLLKPGYQGDLPKKIVLLVQTGMPFCFLCGADLQRWISQNPSEFEALVEKMKEIGEETSYFFER